MKLAWMRRLNKLTRPARAIILEFLSLFFMRIIIVADTGIRKRKRPGSPVVMRRVR